MKSKRVHQLLALHRERIERELAGLLPQWRGPESNRRHHDFQMSVTPGSILT
jgi:hypothetical protein